MLIRYNKVALSFVTGLYFVISESNKKVFSSKIYEVRKGMSSICIPLEQTIALTGDIRVDFFNRPKVKRKVSPSKSIHFSY